MKKLSIVLLTLAPTLVHSAFGQSDQPKEEMNADNKDDKVIKEETNPPIENSPSMENSESQNHLIDSGSGKVKDSLDPTLPLKEELSGAAKKYYASSPEGKTLPKGVMRVRLPLRFANSSEGFDNKGKKSNIGYSLRALVSALVIEYGVNDEISVQFLMPIVYSNKMGLDAKKFRTTNDYKNNFNEVINQVSSVLLKNGECADEASCRELVLSEISPAVAKINTSLKLPSEENLTVNSGVVLRDAADSFVINAIKPHSGKTGIGDIEMGVLWSAVSEKSPLLGVPFYYSIGGGVRLPTGSFKEVPTPGMRTTGRGTFDGAIRQNLDYHPINGLVFSWQNQTEKSFTKAKYREPSLLDSSKLNQANTKLSTLERKGLRNVGFLKTSWGLGNITQDINMFGLYSLFKYDVDSAEYKNGKAANLGRKQAYSTVLGATLDLLSKKIPVQFDVDYEVPLAGKNNRLATSILGFNLKLFYRF